MQQQDGRTRWLAGAEVGGGDDAGGELCLDCFRSRALKRKQ